MSGERSSDSLSEEIKKQAKQSFILERIGKNFWQYFNARNPRQHKTIIEAKDPTDLFYVGGSADDAYEIGDGPFHSDHAHVIIWSNPDPSSAGYLCGGFRFPNVTIPQDSRVLSAAFSAYVYTALRDDINTKIYGNNVANAENFVDNPHIISETYRPRTSAYVSWVQDSMGEGWKEKTGLKNIIQEIVNQNGWSSGNAIVLLLIANTDVRDKMTNFYSYDQDPSYAAKLAVTWEEIAHTVSIESTPISVPVTIDGGAVGSTPVSVVVPEGNHTVAVPSEQERSKRR